jgi:hypothetical protein
MISADAGAELFGNSHENAISALARTLQHLPQQQC